MNAQQLAASLADFYAEDPNRWTQNDEARDANGYACSARNPDAVQWCVSGAVDKLYPVFREHEAWMEMRRLMPGGSVVCFNDAPNRTVEEVIAQLRKIATEASDAGESNGS